MNENNEILIQRCIDNELTSEERQALLQRLEETPEGWKSLACGFVEEQLFADAISAPPESPPKPMPATDRGRAQPAHWFHHPVTSLVLSVCVAFVVGLLVRGELSGSGSGEFPVATTGNSTVTSAPETSPVQPVVQPESDIQVRLVGDGMKSRSLPLYVADQAAANADREWQQIEDYVRRKTRLRNSRTPYIVITMGGRQLIIPVSERNLR